MQRQLEFDARSAAADDLHSAFMKNGCLVLRNAIDPAALGRIKKQTDDAFDRLGNPTHVYEKDIVESSPNRFFRKRGAFDLVETLQFKKFRNLVFKGQPYKRQDATARRIKGRGVDTKSWQEPLKLHLDCFFHPFDLTLNFRIPFDPEGADAPGLQMVPADIRTTIAFSRYSNLPIEGHDGLYNFSHFPTDLLEPGGAAGVYGLRESAITDRFGADCFYRPILQPGDLMILSNWLIHGTHRTEAMSKGRCSVEIRFQAMSFDLAYWSPRA